MKSITNATHTYGGHKILSVIPLGVSQFSVTVESAERAAGKVTYALGKSGRHNMPKYSIKPV